MRLSKPVFLMVFAVLFLSSCTNQPVIPSSPAVSFSKDVQPILIGNCTQSGCHGGDTHRQPLTTYEDDMAVITPGNAIGSTLYQRVSNRGTGGIMPPTGPLSENDLQLIYLWIMQGAKNN